VTDHPLDHILRPPLPWQTDRPALTECGRRVNDVGASISSEEFIARVRKLGQQRTSMTTCMTCYNRAAIGYRQGENWDRNPGAIIARAYERVRFSKDAEVLNRELRAIAMLVEAHRPEFLELVAGLEQTVSLDDRRRARER
jgi:hypothetical protein